MGGAAFPVGGCVLPVGGYDLGSHKEVAMPSFATSYFIDGVEYAAIIVAPDIEKAREICAGRGKKEIIRGVVEDEPDAGVPAGEPVVGESVGSDSGSDGVDDAGA